MANELKGYFVYSKTPKGNFNFRLKASNKETIAVSEGIYTTLSSCKSGIDSVRKFGGIDKIEDQTLSKYETLTNPRSEEHTSELQSLAYPKFEIYKDKQGKFRYRLRANNGNILCISEEGYASKASCKNGIASVGKWAPNADMMSDADFNK